MAIGAALVDRARLVRLAASSERVEGTTQFGEVHGEWFRCRLTLPAASEGKDEPGGYRRALSYPSLLYGAKDVAGNPVVLRFNDDVEVQSPRQLSTFKWKVNGDPQPITKKRTLIGWLANLERNVEREFVQRSV